MFYSNPYARQQPASFQPSSRPSYQPESIPSQDDLARTRYMRALREQRAARQAYTDALAEREVQKLEHGYANNPYVRMNRPSFSSARPHPFPTREDEDTDTSSGFDCDHADILRQRNRERQLAELERRHQAHSLEEQQRLAVLKDEASRRAVNEALLARQTAYEAEQRALQEEQSRRAARYRTEQEQVKMNRPGSRSPPRVKLPASSAEQGHYRKPTSTPVPTEAPTRSASARAPPAPVPAQTPPSPSTSPSSIHPRSPVLSSIASIASAAFDLRRLFSMPDSLDFVPPTDDQPPAKPKLSYAAANRPIREYEEALHRLLEKLDSVESAGITEIRDARRNAVKNIEANLEELDNQVELEWRKLHPGGRPQVNPSGFRKGCKTAALADNSAEVELWQEIDMEDVDSEPEEIELTPAPSWPMPALQLP